MSSTKESGKVLHPHYRPDIDGLRAVAVLSVLIFHAFPEHLPGGFIGVDIFFVISGYLICTIIFQNLAQNSFHFLDFYSRRIQRIFPALITVLLSSWLLAWFTLLPEEFKSLGKHILGGAGFVSNLVLWSESGYFDAASSTKPLLHLWSLGIEEQFYLLWPILMWVAYRFKIPFIFSTLFVLLLSFSFNLFFISASPVAVFYSPITRIWELLFGSVLAWSLLPSRQHSSTSIQSRIQALSLFKRNCCALLGIFFIFLSLSCITEDSVFPGWWALLPVMGSALLILSGPSAWVNQKLLSYRGMVWLGLISFPLYLWHWPLLSFMRIIDGSNSAGMRLSMAMISILLAWLTYRFIERPLRFGPRLASQSAKARITWILMAFMCVVAYMGYAAYVRDGIPVQRMLFRSSNPLLNEILTYKFQTGSAWRMGSCYLTERQGAGDFKSCDTVIDPAKPTVVLWGDSHAAHLYPGFKQIYAGDFNLVQRTASACPPIIQMDKVSRPSCREINDQTLDLIAKLHPQHVVLAGNWRDNPWADLSKTIKSLKALGIPNIDLVGPVPAWVNNLPKQIFLYCKKNVPCDIPVRMQMGLVPNVFELDRLMTRFANRENVNYLSPINVLCDSQGCLVRTGDAGNTITAWDSEHLTDEGSRYLVSRFGHLINRGR